MMIEKTTRLGEAYREIQGWLGLGSVWAAVAFLCIILSLTGAFDTSSIKSMVDRGILFGVVVGFGSVLCLLAAAVLRALKGISAFNNFRVSIAIGAVSIPFGAVSGRLIQQSMIGEVWSWELVFRSSVHGSFVVSAVLVMMYMSRFHALASIEIDENISQPQKAAQFPPLWNQKITT